MPMKLLLLAFDTPGNTALEGLGTGKQCAQTLGEGEDYQPTPEVPLFLQDC